MSTKICQLNMMLVCLLGSGLTFAADDLEKNFVSPPHEAKPWVYYWFQGGYGNPEGMARDIAAMKEKGIGGIMHMQTVNLAGLPVPKRPKMLSPEWEAWFGEMLRLGQESGMSLSASILDGWSHGGWWVGKEDGAKQLVYSETQVDGPNATPLSLPQPLTRLGVYRDVAVVAFREKTARPPVPSSAKADNVKDGYCGQQYWPVAHALDGDPETYWCSARPATSGAPISLELTFTDPVSATGVFIAGMPKAGPAEGRIQVSEDGKVFRDLTGFTMVAGENKQLSFSETTGRAFRLLITKAHAPDLQLAEFAVLRKGDKPVWRHGVKYWDLKSANFGGGWGGWPSDLYRALEEDYPMDAVSDLAAADVLDLTGKLTPDGKLDWQAPAGRWTVLRFGWTPLAEPARMGSGGYEVDVLNPKGADLMMDKAAKPMRDLSAKCAAGAPIIFHTDSWEIGAGLRGQQPTWTDDFREQFKKRRGYDLLRHLPAMARRIVDDRETTNRFLRDYRDTVADLLAAYYGRLQQRAHELSGGINSESGYGSFPHPHMDGLQIFGRADRPMAEFWHPFGGFRSAYLQQVDVMRTAASGARIYGNRFVQAETLTYNASAGQFTPLTKYRRTLHEAWARGLNQAVIHKYTHQPLEQKPGLQDYDIFNRHYAWWPLSDGFFGYIGRSQHLLQQGDFAADALYFVGEGASRFVPGKDHLNPVLPSGYEYDGVNAEVILSRLSVKDGLLRLPVISAAVDVEAGVGPSYRYLVLSQPQCRTLTPGVLEKIRDLVKSGATLVGPPPEGAPGLSDRVGAETKVKALVTELWGDSIAAEGERKVGAGRVVWGRTMAAILAADGVKPDLEVASAAKTDLPWIHRRVSQGDIYFLSNPSPKPLAVSVALRAKGKSVRLFDPLDGSTRELAEWQVTSDGRTTLPVVFEPEQAFFVVVGEGVKADVVAGQASASEPTKNFPELKPLLEMSGPWQVTFDAAWVKPLPTGVAPGIKELHMDFPQLVDWTRHPEPGIKAYSGLATYRTTFDLATPVGNQAFIGLGIVSEMTRVTLNGCDLGVAWCPPWRLRIPAGVLKERGNELVVAVANNWNNRLFADNALPVADRLTQTRKELYDLAAKQGFQSAGLLGPIQILSESNSKDEK